MHCVHAKSKKEYHYAFKVFNLFCLSYYDYLGCSTERGNGLKNPKYIEMRMNELYPVKKSRPWLPSGKENSKVYHLSDSSFLFIFVQKLRIYNSFVSTTGKWCERAVRQPIQCFFTLKCRRRQKASTYSVKCLRQFLSGVS